MTLNFWSSSCCHTSNAEITDVPTIPSLCRAGDWKWNQGLHGMLGNYLPTSTVTPVPSNSLGPTHQDNVKVSDENDPSYRRFQNVSFNLINCLWSKHGWCFVCLLVCFLNIHVEGLDCLRKITIFRTLHSLRHLYKIQKVSSDTRILFSSNSSVNDSAEAILVTCRNQELTTLKNLQA